MPRLPVHRLAIAALYWSCRPTDANVIEPRDAAVVTDDAPPPDVSAVPDVAVVDARSGDAALVDFDGARPQLLWPWNGTATHAQILRVSARIPPNATGFQMMACRDRALSMRCQSLGIMTMPMPTEQDLSVSAFALTDEPGWWFWSAALTRTGAQGGGLLPDRSATWQFWVPYRNNVLDRYAFNRPQTDFDGDGRADVLAAYLEGPREGRVRLIRGGAVDAPLVLRSTVSSMIAAAPSVDFGSRLAPVGDIDGDGYLDLVASAPTATIAGQATTGFVTVFRGASDGLGLRLQSLGAPADSARFGSALAAIGDANGDGYADFAVGAQRGAGGLLAKVFFGGARGVSEMPQTIAANDADQAYAVLLAGGDFDGDRFGDLLLGGVSAAIPNRWRAQLFRGGATGITATPAATLEWSGDRDIAAQAALAGDVDQDGYADLVVSAPSATGAGAVLLFRGTATGIAESSPQVIAGPEVGALFGVSVAAAGDVNADGFDDVLVGAPNATNPSAMRSGAVTVLYGSSSGLSIGNATTIHGASAGDRFGASVAGCGDFDGDAIADVVVGAPNVTVAGQPSAGSAFIYRGGAGGVAATAARTWSGTAAGQQLGLAVR